MAEKKSAKEAGPDDIMSPAEMKQILAQARRGNPANCVIGLTKDKSGVILLDKRRKPKQLMAEIKKKAAGLKLELDATSLRFGRAEVDTEVDGSLLTFSVNKDAPGAMRPKLLERIKKAGFGKIEIVVDTGLETEPEDDEQPAAPAAAPAAPHAAETTPPDQGAAGAGAAVPPASPAAPVAGLDAGALTKTLTDLVRTMIPVIAADPTRGDALKSLATQTQSALKAGDLAGASGRIEELRRALNGASPQPSAAAPATSGGPGDPAFVKARLAWVAARNKVESEVGKLHTEMTTVFKDHGFGAHLDKFFNAKVEPILGNLDEALAEKLDEVSKATDPGQHARLVGEARSIIQRYESYVAGEKLIADLDQNPFVPLSIEKTLTATLTTLSRAMG